MTSLSKQDTQPQPATLTNAQYSVYGREQHWGAESYVAHGLSLTRAKLVQTELMGKVEQFWPGPRFGAPSFNIALRMPVFEKNAVVRPGDFVARRIEVGRKPGAGDSETFSNLMIVGVATSIDGANLLLRDMSGQMVEFSGPYWVFEAKQFDEKAVESELAGRWNKHVVEGRVGYSWGFFDNAGAVAAALRMHLKPIDMVLPRRGDVSRIVGFDVGDMVFAVDVGEKGGRIADEKGALDAAPSAVESDHCLV
jgi:hypothetical protein